MSQINAITGSNAYEAVQTTGTRKTQQTSKKEDSAAVVYEKSTDITKMSDSDRATLVQMMKEDQEARKSQLTSLVMDMMQKQGSVFAQSQDEDSIWKFLASGDFTVDAKTKAAAQEAISEDGYWGVEQTSQRIFDFALALSGGDDDKMDKMLSAFEKGFKEATKSWGKELPEISQNTYDAVHKKFEEYKNSQSEE